ncbi:hypothetical protein AB4Y90_12000 [Chryseobacterium sp. 2TAF14]|uniref:hypothetical protein n=1 Tax=Chryseobacterium sp. 2TAF14 TaxID=3233007 RepID=UPI003F8DA066
MSPGLIYDKNKEVKRKPITKYFDEGYWTDENDLPIKEAFLGDTVRFHVKMKNKNEKNIAARLIDSDIKEGGKNQSIEVGNDEKGYHFINYYKIDDNDKVVISIKLQGKLAELINNEEDKTLELFYACSHSNENIDLPFTSNDYLKVKEKEPLIVYVCGYWNKSMPYAGTEWGEKYWGSLLKNSAKKYFYNTTKELFINGAGEKGDGGKKRFNMGKKLAEERLANPNSKFYQEIFENKRKIMFVSHSMGGAFAEGMISVINQKKVNIEKVIHLSPADVSGFSVTLPEKTFQIDINWDPVLMYKNFDDAPTIDGVKFSAVAKNPNEDKFGHMYTKQEAFVWHWFEDLELVNFQFINQETKTYYTPSGGMGYGGTSHTVLQKNYAAIDLKHNSIFLKVRKNSKIFFYDKKNNKYYTEE